MKDLKTENFLNDGNYKWKYIGRIDFTDIDLEQSKLNPTRMFRQIDENLALSYGIAMEAGSEFPAIVLLTLEGSPFKYLIATGVHRVEGAQMMGKTSFDAYVVTEADSYRRELLCRLLNSIEGFGISIDDRLAQIIQLHQGHPERSLTELAKSFHLKTDTVKNAWYGQKAIDRARTFGYDFVNGKVKLSKATMRDLDRIHNDRVYDAACQFAVTSGATSNEVGDVAKELQKCRDEKTAFGVIERAKAKAIERTMMAKARHGRIPAGPSTQFFAACRALNNRASRGIEHLYLKAHPDKVSARLLALQVIDVLKRVVEELDHINRVETAHGTAATSLELH